MIKKPSYGIILIYSITESSDSQLVQVDCFTFNTHEGIKSTTQMTNLCMFLEIKKRNIWVRLQIINAMELVKTQEFANPTKLLKMSIEHP